MTNVPGAGLGVLSFMFGIYSRIFRNDRLGLGKWPFLRRVDSVLSRKIAQSFNPSSSRGAGTEWAGDRTATEHASLAPRGDADETERHRYRSKSGFIFTDLICAILPSSERFTILDGGAREVAIDPRWRSHDPRRLRFYGFEIDAIECERLNHQTSNSEIESRYFPIGLWSGSNQKTFYVTKSSGGCSLFPVNHPLTDRWKMQNSTDILLPREAMKVERTEQVSVDSLDNISKRYNFEPLDFMKLNVQGAELEILKGASSLLPRTLGMQVEISFVESYVGRPLFSDIDAFLRAHGFVFFDLIGHHYLGRERSPVTVRHLPALSDILHGQFIEGHGIYFRDPIDSEIKGFDLTWANQTTLLKLASLAEVYHQIEFAVEVLDWSVGFLKKQGDTNGADVVRRIHQAGVEKYLLHMS